MAALDANGLLIEIDEIDQDEFMMTGLFFKATDKFTMYGTPAMKFNRVKIGYFDFSWIL